MEGGGYFVGYWRKEQLETVSHGPQRYRPFSSSGRCSTRSPINERAGCISCVEWGAANLEDRRAGWKAKGREAVLQTHGTMTFQAY